MLLVYFCFVSILSIIYHLFQLSVYHQIKITPSFNASYVCDYDVSSFFQLTLLYFYSLFLHQATLIMSWLLILPQPPFLYGFVPFQLQTSLEIHFHYFLSQKVLSLLQLLTLAPLVTFGQCVFYSFWNGAFSCDQMIESFNELIKILFRFLNLWFLIDFLSLFLDQWLLIIISLATSRPHSFKFTQSVPVLLFL